MARNSTIDHRSMNKPNLERETGTYKVRHPSIGNKGDKSLDFAVFKFTGVRTIVMNSNLQPRT